MRMVETGGDKAIIAAARVLVQMVAQTHRHEPLRIEHDHRHIHAVIDRRRELAGVAQRLGVDPTSIGLPAVESEGGSTTVDGADGQDAKD